jgi:putative transcriptional regulator
LALAALALAAGAASAQTLRDGMLLVASPELDDANFSKAVVLVLRHDATDGTIGVVVNRATSLEPRRVFPELEELIQGYTGHVYRGGPVAPAQLLFLVHGLAAAVVQGSAVVDDVYVSGNPELLPELAALGENEQGLRLYAGHVAWRAGQLSNEVSRGNWKVIDGSAALVFHPEPGRLWEHATTLASELVVQRRD